MERKKMKKIAVCIPTYNHPDTVEDVLGRCINVYNAYGLDFFYFDGSTDDRTKNVVAAFIEKGFSNLYYFHIEDKNGEERFNMIMSAEGVLSEYEYIWYCKDRSYCTENSIEKIVETAGKHPDIIFFGMLVEFASDELVYDNSVDFYGDWGWLATSMDVAIVRRETILKNFYRDKYMNEYWRHFMLIFNELANLDKVQIVVLNSKCAGLYNSNLTKSMWTDKVFKIWIDEWISANENLNEIYHVYMDRIIKMATSLPWILGGERRLVELHELGVLNPECLDVIQKDWDRVSDVPFEKVRQIAEGKAKTIDFENKIIELFECFLQVPVSDTLFVLEKCLNDFDDAKQSSIGASETLKTIRKIARIVRMEFQCGYVPFIEELHTFSEVLDKYQKTVSMLQLLDVGEDEDIVFEGIQWLVQNLISPCVVKVICEEEQLENHKKVCNTLAVVYEELSQHEVSDVFLNLQIDKGENE